VSGRETKSTDCCKALTHCLVLSAGTIPILIIRIRGQTVTMVRKCSHLEPHFAGTRVDQMVGFEVLEAHVR
jgi:hypothetical protein